MNYIIRSLLLTVLVLIVGATFGPADAMPSGSGAESGAITYQGRIESSGEPLDGIYAMSFRLYDAEQAGSQVVPAINLGKVEVEDGLFSVTLDFDQNAFTGDARWLEIDVEGTTLSPRQLLTSAPFALYSLNGKPGPEGPEGPEGPPGEANIQGTQGNLVRFSSATTGSDSIITDNGDDVTVGGAPRNQKLKVTGGINMNQPDSALYVNGNRTLSYIGSESSGNILIGPGGAVPGGDSNFNIGVGIASIQAITTGDENTAIGHQGLVNLTTGNRNTAVGLNTLTNVTDGSENVALGQFAGENLDQGDNNIYIGNNAGAESESNTIRIGQGSSRAFVAGVRSSDFPAAVDSEPVVVMSDGQLGTPSSCASGTVLKKTDAGWQCQKPMHGFQRVESSCALVEDGGAERCEALAHCPPGKRLLSGGGDTSCSGIWFSRSYPLDQDTWAVIGKIGPELNCPGDPSTVTAFALCVDDNLFP